MNFQDYCSYLVESKNDAEFSEEIIEKLKKAGFRFNSSGIAFVDFISGSTVKNILAIVSKDSIDEATPAVDIILYGNKIKDDEKVEVNTGVILTDSVIKKLPKLIKATEKFVKDTAEFNETFWMIDE